MPIIEDVVRLRNENHRLTWEQMAKALNYSSGEALRSQYRRALSEQTVDALEIGEDSNRVLVEYFFDKRPSMQWRDLIEIASTRAEELGHNIVKSATIDIHGNQPVALVFSGDWHLGDMSLNYETWRKDIELVLATPGMYLVDVGDSIQNMRSFKDLSAVLSQALSPKDQAYLMRDLVQELTDKNKLICKVEGNHDFEFDERIFGEALQGYLLASMKAPRFSNKGLVFLNVGEQQYTLYVFHKSRFRSIYRAAHGSWREWQFGYPADIVAGGHDHTPAFEMMSNYVLARESGAPFGGLTFLIKVGTYQDDKYGWKYFHNGGRPEAITVVLWPDEHRMQPFLSIADATRFLETFKEDNHESDIT